MSDRKRIRRIQRLLKLSETRRDAAQAELARAQAEVDAAQVSTDNAERSLEVGEGRMFRKGGVAVADFADAHAYVRTLRFAVAQAHQEQRVAEDRASERRDEATGAHREVRKMEIWGESTVERARAEEARTDQRDTDELAARLAGRQP